FPSVVHHHHHHDSPSSFNFGSGPVFNFSSPTHHYFRDGCSGWNVTWQADYSRRPTRESGSTATFPGDFLTLAPPATNNTTTTAAGGGYCNSSFRLNDPRHFQRTTEKSELDSSSLHSYHHHHHHRRRRHHQQQQQPAGVCQSQRGCSFFPHEVIDVEDERPSSVIMNNSNGTNQDHHHKHENVDLNLKL
ncbi:unnamed protein product, partial [Linum tenue]